ncbi:hypothetical protein [Oceaniglobus indicus]|uniref:hypothetical protein n=1 Tax=Oceaniglobus indicus TaxID=2047749 RepID=UPI000C1A6C3C|nr:hypothetical protein [Oceaniglobus indicus]
MIRIVTILSVTALLAACVPQEQTRSIAPSPGTVSFAPLRDDRPGSCIVGYTVSYPEGIAPHARRITVEEPAIGASNSYDLPIPPLGPPSAFTRTGGTETFSMLGEATVVDCTPELTRRILTVGPCTQGQCAPARFAPDASLASLGVTGRVRE